MIAKPLHEACVLVLPRCESASGARTFLAGHLAEWGADDDAVEVAVLLVSELVTNAIVHAGTAAEVSVAMDDSIVRVGVADTNPTGIQVRPYARMATSGRGLRIVDSLAERWGVDADDRTKTIWFELASAS